MRDNMKIEVGKWYRQKNGLIVGPVQPLTSYSSNIYTFEVANTPEYEGSLYTDDGRTYLDCLSERDLIEEATDPERKEIQIAQQTIDDLTLSFDHVCKKNIELERLRARDEKLIQDLTHSLAQANDNTFALEEEIKDIIGISNNESKRADQAEDLVIALESEIRAYKKVIEELTKSTLINDTYMAVYPTYVGLVHHDKPSIGDNCLGFVHSKTFKNRDGSTLTTSEFEAIEK